MRRWEVISHVIPPTPNNEISYRTTRFPKRQVFLLAWIWTFWGEFGCSAMVLLMLNTSYFSSSIAMLKLQVDRQSHVQGSGCPSKKSLQFLSIWKHSLTLHYSALWPFKAPECSLGETLLPPWFQCKIQPVLSTFRTFFFLLELHPRNYSTANITSFKVVEEMNSRRKTFLLTTVIYVWHTLKQHSKLMFIVTWVQSSLSNGHYFCFKNLLPTTLILPHTTNLHSLL